VTRVRGVGEDPDLALRAQGRYVALGGAVLLGAVGLLFALAGAFAPLGAGETRGPATIATGLVFVALAAAYVATQRGPVRRDLPPAEQRTGGVALPVRRGYRAAGAAAFVAVAALGVVLALDADSAGPRLLGVALVLLGAGVALAWRRLEVQIVLDPDGVTLPGDRRPRRIAWADVHDVATLDGWLPTLAVGAAGRRLVTTRLAGQAWPPSVLVAVLDHYGSEAGRGGRHELDRATALDRFRGT
jgi:hypothetical protein